MNVSEVLDRAADLIVRDGWWTAPGGGRGSCASNAIVRVSNCGLHPAHCCLALAVGGDPAMLFDPTPIFHWNDAPERTAAEVIAMLRACAATERARESRLLPVIRETVCA